MRGTGKGRVRCQPPRAPYLVPRPSLFLDASTIGAVPFAPMAKRKVGPWEAVDALLRTATAVERRLARVVEPAGITLSQFRVLRILRAAGEPGLPTLAIRDRMIDDAPGVTRLLNRLERAGLARRERSTSDRRLVHCHATPAGLALLARLDAEADAVDRRAAGVLTGKEQRRLLRALDAIRSERPVDEG